MRVVVVLDCLQPERLAQFWAEVLHYRQAPSSEPYVVLVPDAQPGPDLFLQRVPEPKVGKNRMHLDLRVATLESELARLTALGTQVLSPNPIDEDGFSWVVMADPEGNDPERPFCPTLLQEVDDGAAII
jgi:predicted enzyme related to lactoylglutathione lyase